jgi:hypothetical protein
MSLHHCVGGYLRWKQTYIRLTDNDEGFCASVIHYRLFLLLQANHRPKVPGKSVVSSRASGKNHDITLWNTNSEIQDITDFRMKLL